MTPINMQQGSATYGAHNFRPGTYSYLWVERGRICMKTLPKGVDLNDIKPTAIRSTNKSTIRSLAVRLYHQRMTKTQKAYGNLASSNYLIKKNVSFK